MFPSDSLPARIQPSSRTLLYLREALIPYDIGSESKVDLVINIRNVNLNVREFAAYLDFIDRTFGKVSTKGLKSYAQNRHLQLEIDYLRVGSLEVVITEALTSSRATYLIVTWLILKYAPTGLSLIASSYSQYEAGRLARVQRREIEARMEEDEVLRRLDRTQRKELVRLMVAHYQQERRNSSKVRRFAQRSVIDIRLEAEGKSNYDEPR